AVSPPAGGGRPAQRPRPRRQRLAPRRAGERGPAMTHALLWKEYREHRSVWLAVAVLTALATLGLRLALAPNGLQAEPQVRDAAGVTVRVLAWTYGMVCGAMMLAGECEARTQAFLDALPAYRMSLWRRKCAIGAAFLFAQLAVLAGLALVTGAVGPG